ncbi:MAG: HIT family protein [Firmicutes bacterium]|nr:HIT family protein [Bacillota bacterium]
MEHLKVFSPEKYLVKDFEYWVVLQRYNHLTLGACVFCLKRDISSLAEMTTAESGELQKVCAWFENKTKSLYGAEKFNYLALMMKDPFVHFHAFPRYSKTQERHGRAWHDVSWPLAIKIDLPNDCDEKTLNKIIAEMKE